MLGDMYRNYILRYCVKWNEVKWSEVDRQEYGRETDEGGWKR